MVRKKWNNEKISEIREARSSGLKLKEIETKFSLSKNQVNYAVYKYRMKEPPAKFSLSGESYPEKSKKQDWIDAYDAKEKDKVDDQIRKALKKDKKKSFLEWLLG